MAVKIFIKNHTDDFGSNIDAKNNPPLRVQALRAPTVKRHPIIIDKIMT